jgi:hypothetical protein
VNEEAIMADRTTLRVLLALSAAAALAGCETVAEEAAQVGQELRADLRPVGGGSGVGRVLLAPNDTTNQICADLEVSGVGPVTAAHVHSASSGVAYFDIAVEDDNDADDCDVVDDALLDFMRRNPTAFYVDVHTAARPGGALRGTLRPDWD